MTIPDGMKGQADSWCWGRMLLNTGRQSCHVSSKNTVGISVPIRDCDWIFNKKLCVRKQGYRDHMEMLLIVPSLSSLPVAVHLAKFGNKYITFIKR